MFNVNPAEVRRLMIEHGLTIRELSRAAQVTETTAAKFLRGAQCNARTLSKLARALGVSGEQLLRGGSNT